MAKKLSFGQLEALRDFAARNGRNWKSKLREKWMNGAYDWDSDDSQSLQSIRNQFGPSWLVRWRDPGIRIINEIHNTPRNLRVMRAVAMNLGCERMMEDIGGAQTAGGIACVLWENLTTCDSPELETERYIVGEFNAAMARMEE